MSKFILASASPRRRQLLDQVGLVHECIASGIDEEVDHHLTPEQRAVSLALKKAVYVAETNPDAVVIGADTLVTLGAEVLEKPKNRADAASMLKKLSGKRHAVHTGLAVADQGGNRHAVHCESTWVDFRLMDPDEIEWYLDSEEYADKAGAYGIQGQAALFVERIEGCYFNVVGLPLSALYRLLKEFGAGIENFKVPDSTKKGE